MAQNTSLLRSLGIGSSGFTDPYADGKAAKVFQHYIGDKTSRTKNYKNFLVGLLKRNGCKRILDAACGTGVDSIMLLEEGFEVVSVDASDKMLKHAFQARWTRRKEDAFDKWIIEEGNWLTLDEDIEDYLGNGFDAVICLGNSFSHLLDNYGDQREHKQAFRNFDKCLKPGGLLVIDHRNYDTIIKTGRAGKSENPYYPTNHADETKTTVIYVDAEPSLIIRDYQIVTPVAKKNNKNGKTEDSISQYSFVFYPHNLQVFAKQLKDVFGENSKYSAYGDFKQLDEIEDPQYYIHVVEKSR